MKMDKGLYIKAKGTKSQSKLAHKSPHVPFDHVWGKGNVQELMSSTRARSLTEWDFLFQVLNLKEGNFLSLKQLEQDVEDLSRDSQSFRTPAKKRTVVEDNNAIESKLFSEDRFDSVVKTEDELDQLKLAVKGEPGAPELTTERFRQLSSIVEGLLDGAASRRALAVVKADLVSLQRQQEVTTAKIVDVLLTLGVRTKGEREKENVYAELDRLLDDLLELTKRFRVLEEVGLGVKSKLDKTKMEVNDEFQKAGKIFINLMDKQKLLSLEIEKVKKMCKDKVRVQTVRSLLDGLMGGHMTVPGVRGMMKEDLLMIVDSVVEVVASVLKRSRL